jgi:excisionase family DNA binding protein
MPETITNCGTGDDALPARLGDRLSVKEIAHRLDIGRLAVYAMLEQGLLPGIRIGRRWIVTRHAYGEWERTCGTRGGTGLETPPEVCC